MIFFLLDQPKNLKISKKITSISKEKIVLLKNLHLLNLVDQVECGNGKHRCFDPTARRARRSANPHQQQVDHDGGVEQGVHVHGIETRRTRCGRSEKRRGNFAA